MGKTFVDISMSLDGFIAGPNDRPGNGLGDGGEALHDWAYGLESWREPHGLEGGSTGPDSDILEEAMRDVRAIVIGRWMYECAEGWGEDPPFRVPVFVLTHNERPREVKGETTFAFVTDGLESALAQARDAAREGNIAIGGGASVVQQYLAAGAIDEMQIHIAPLLLGGGKRLFGETPGMTFEPIRVVESPAVTHIKYRVLR